MLTRFKVENFRNLESVDLELGPANVLIGPNGCGKSSLLEAIRFLFALFKKPFGEVLSEFGGARFLPTAGREDQPIRFAATIEHGNNRVELELDLRVEDGRARLVKEREYYRIAGAADQREVHFDRQAEGFVVSSDLANVLFKPSRSGWIAPDVFDRLLPTMELESTAVAKDPYGVDLIMALEGVLAVERDGAVFLRAFDWITSPEMRGASALKDWRGYGFDPLELSSCLNWLWNEEKHLASRESLDSLLVASVPGFEGLRFKPAGEGDIELHMEFEGQQRSIPLRRLSDGIATLLCLGGYLAWPQAARVWNTSEAGGLLAIEEPELGLHPSAIGIVGEHLKLASERRQIIVTTHSPTLLREFEPADIITVDLVPRDGRAVPVFTRLTDKEHVQRWLDGYDVGTAWQMGALGAKP